MVSFNDRHWVLPDYLSKFRVLLLVLYREVFKNHQAQLATQTMTLELFDLQSITDIFKQKHNCFINSVTCICDENNRETLKSPKTLSLPCTLGQDLHDSHV